MGNRGMTNWKLGAFTDAIDDAANTVIAAGSKFNALRFTYTAFNDVDSTNT